MNCAQSGCKINRPGRMHVAERVHVALDNKPSRLLRLLAGGREHTSLELAVRVGTVAIATTASCLRRHGCAIECLSAGKSKTGARIYVYRMTFCPPELLSRADGEDSQCVGGCAAAPARLPDYEPGSQGEGCAMIHSGDF